MTHRARSLIAVLAVTLFSHAAIAGKPAVQASAAASAPRKGIGGFLRGLLGKNKGVALVQHEAHEPAPQGMLLAPKIVKGKQTTATVRPSRAASTAAKLAKLDEKPELREDTFGEKAADKVATFAGSWKFISAFSLGMGVWMAFNTFSGHSFDAPPFIGLNLLLSTVAALQAPFILMSQNRQSQKDRIRSEEDFAINVKSEHEVAQLHDKIDTLSDNVRVLTETLAKQQGTTGKRKN